MLRRAVLPLALAAAGLLASCEGVCGCLSPPPTEVVYGRVESATGNGIATAVVLYRLTSDTACVLDMAFSQGEIDVKAEGRFRGEVEGSDLRLQCLELRAFDPAIGE